MKPAGFANFGPGVDEDRKRALTVERGGADGREARRRGPRGLSRRVLAGPQTVEAYLRASSPPRYMQRLREIEVEYQRQRRRLEDAYRWLEEECGRDSELFAQRWRAEAARWPFAGLNELIREHNDWYPVESDLPMDPRTRDYVPIRGASYRRVELGRGWILEHFPPSGRAPTTPAAPSRVPREASGAR